MTWLVCCLSKQRGVRLQVSTFCSYTVLKQDPAGRRGDIYIYENREENRGEIQNTKKGKGTSPRRGVGGEEIDEEEEEKEGGV